MKSGKGDLTRGQWQHAKRLLAAAMERAPADRAAFLEVACGGDASLRDELNSLLSSHEETGSFLEVSAFQMAEEVVGDETGDSAVGRRLGSYRLIREIGRGGMGTVYLAERNDDQYRRQVAIKVIKRGMDTDLIVRRFRHERQILANLDHPNIARLLDGGTTGDGLPFFVMEYIEGEPLNRYCDARGLSITDRLLLFRTVCAPVQYAHQNLVVHRDLKPANIVVTPAGVPKLLDFGLAKLMSPDNASGLTGATGTQNALTPDYASPEQLRGDPITTAADVYSLGVVLYEMLTGRRPRPGASDGVIEKPSVSADDAKKGRQFRGDLDTIVLTALREEPERRYASVEQLSEDVRRFLEALPVSARPDAFGYRSTKFVRRNRAGVAAAILLVLALLGGVLATGWQARVARAERVKAEGQRRLAEGRFNDVRVLVNSLLFDLDGELEKLPGSTSARELLVTRALQYLDRLAREAQENRLLRLELATAYLKVGDIQGKPYAANVGDTKGALESYRKARALLEDLARAGQSQSGMRRSEIKRDLSVANQRVSVVEVRQGNWAMAEESGAVAVALAGELVAAEPDNSAYRGLLADNHLYFGQAAYRAGLSSSTATGRRLALRSFGRSLEIRQGLSALEPTRARQSDVASSYASIGYGHWAEAHATGDSSEYRTALENILKAQFIREELLAAEPSPRFRRAVADGLREIGQLHMKLGAPQRAMRSFGQALPMMEALSAADSANVEARRDLASTHLGMAPALAELGATAQATTHARIALSMLTALRRIDPTSSEDRRLLSEARMFLKRFPGTVSGEP